MCINKGAKNYYQRRKIKKNNNNNNNNKRKKTSEITSVSSLIDQYFSLFRPHSRFFYPFSLSISLSLSHTHTHSLSLFFPLCLPLLFSFFLLSSSTFFSSLNSFHITLFVFPCLLFSFPLLFFFFTFSPMSISLSLSLSLSFSLSLSLSLSLSPLSLPASHLLFLLFLRLLLRTCFIPPNGISVESRLIPQGPKSVYHDLDTISPIYTGPTWWPGGRLSPSTDRHGA